MIQTQQATMENIIDHCDKLLSDETQSTLIKLWHRQLKYLENNNIARPHSGIDKFQKDMISDCLDYIGCTPETMSDPTIEFNSYDLSYEWADGHVNIYFSDIYDCTSIFANYTSEAMKESCDTATDIESLLQRGELKFYETLACEVTDALASFNQ